MSLFSISGWTETDTYYKHLAESGKKDLIVFLFIFSVLALNHSSSIQRTLLWQFAFSNLCLLSLCSVRAGK